MPGLLPGVESRYRNIIIVPACVIVAELNPVICIPFKGLDISLDFKQMTHEELNGSLIMTTLLPHLYKYSLNLLYVSLKWQFPQDHLSHHMIITSSLSYRLHQIMLFNQLIFVSITGSYRIGTLCCSTDNFQPDVSKNLWINHIIAFNNL